MFLQLHTIHKQRSWRKTLKEWMGHDGTNKTAVGKKENSKKDSAFLLWSFSNVHQVLDFGLSLLSPFGSLVPSKWLQCLPFKENAYLRSMFGYTVGMKTTKSLENIFRQIAVSGTRFCQVAWKACEVQEQIPAAWRLKHIARGWNLKLV